MSVKVLLLILASTLLGAGSLCRCEDVVRVQRKASACGHCPPETAPQPGGCPVSACCCVQDGVDRATEDPFSVAPASVAVEFDVNPAAPALPAEIRLMESTERRRGVPRREGPPLYILFQHFII